MTDEHDRRLAERSRALRDETPHPGGWDDVLRRADRLEGDHDAARRPGRRTWLGGLAAVTAAVAIFAVLFVAGLWNPTSSEPAARQGVRGVRYVTNQTDNFTTGTGRVRGSLGLEHRVDFERRIDHQWAVDWPVGMNPEPPMETIVTADYVYERVPMRRRAQSGGKGWVRFRLDMDWDDLYSAADFADPLAAHEAKHPGTPELVGADRAVGRVARRYRARETTDGTLFSYEYWVDDAGHLVRSLMSAPSRITADTNSFDVSVLESDARLSLLEPPPEETLDVGSRAEAEALLDLRSGFRSSDPDVPHVVIEASGRRMTVPMSVESTMDVSRIELIYQSPAGTRYLEAPPRGGESALCIVELTGPPDWTTDGPTSPCVTRAQLAKQGGWLFVQRTPNSSTVSGVAILSPGEEAVSATAAGSSLTPSGRVIPFSSIPLGVRELQVTTRTGSRTIPLPTPEARKPSARAQGAAQPKGASVVVAPALDQVVAVVRDDGRVEFPTAVKQQVDLVNRAFERCMVAHGAKVDPVGVGVNRIDGDATKCRSERAAAIRLAASDRMRAADRSREAAAETLIRCVASRSGREPDVVARQASAGALDEAAVGPCVTEARNAACTAATP